VPNAGKSTLLAASTNAKVCSTIIDTITIIIIIIIIIMYHNKIIMTTLTTPIRYY
jgi:GTPase involved in cell partitioning and DNA repair